MLSIDIKELESIEYITISLEAHFVQKIRVFSWLEISKVASHNYCYIFIIKIIRDIAHNTGASIRSFEQDCYVNKKKAEQKPKRQQH